MSGDDADISRSRLVVAVGVAQIVSWGTLFYTIAVLGAPMRQELGVGEAALFGSFSAGLALSGALAPIVGRAIDARGGRRVLIAGSGLAAVALAVLAASTGPWMLAVGWLLAGAAMSATLYDPAFATLHQWTGAAYRRCVTAVTLFGGLASTVFWPLSQWLHEAWGWRAAFLVFAALHVVVCVPLYALGVPRGARRRERPTGDPAPVAVPAASQGVVFAWLAAALAGASFLTSALSAHLIGLLTLSGMQARDAVLVGSIVGPMQVVGRLMEFAFLRRLPPVAVGTLAFGTLVVAMLLLTQATAGLALAFAYALAYGWGNGVLTIVRGTVPAELFGGNAFGALLGRLARPQLVARASAPLVTALLLGTALGAAWTAWACVAVAVLSFAAYRRALAAAHAGTSGDGTPGVGKPAPGREESEVSR